MKAEYAIPILVIITLGISLHEANAELVGQESYLVEGSGFAVTEDSIKISEIDFLIELDRQIGSRASLVVQDGFVTLGDMDFFVSDVTGIVLSDGRFIRIVGTASNDFGDEVSISFFGRIVEDSTEGSVYSITGRLTQGTEFNKIIYTTKISGLTTSISPTQPTLTTGMDIDKEEIVIHIRKGAHDISQFSYIDVAQPQTRGPYTQDRIIIDPGTTITWVNDNDVSHSISSGTGLGSNTRASQGKVTICDESKLQTFEFDPGHGSSGSSFKSILDPITRKGIDCTFTLDGRIKSGEILPGKSWSVTVDEPGFYRLADVDYIWMTSTIYAFYTDDADIIRKSLTNPLN